MSFDEYEKRFKTYCKHLGTTPEEVFGESRTRKSTGPRQVLMYLAYDRFGLGYAPIGRFFGRDHTTVMYACKTVPKKLTELYEHLLQGHRKAEARASTAKMIGDWKQKRNAWLARNPNIKLRSVVKPISITKPKIDFEYTYHSRQEQARRMMQAGMLTPQAIQRLTGIRV